MASREKPLTRGKWVIRFIRPKSLAEVERKRIASDLEIQFRLIAVSPWKY